MSRVGRTPSTCLHISAASRRNLTVSLPAASSPLKARSSPHWASLAKHSTWHNLLSSKPKPRWELHFGAMAKARQV